MTSGKPRSTALLGRCAGSSSACWAKPPAASGSERQRLLEHALSLYRGAFLDGDAVEPWSLPTRERLRGRFIRHSAKLGRLREECGEWNKAIACYQRGAEADQLAEEFYQGLMRCYRRLDRRAEGIAVYRRLRQTLSIILGIAASPATEECSGTCCRCRCLLRSPNLILHLYPACNRAGTKVIPSEAPAQRQRPFFRTAVAQAIRLNAT